MTLIISNFKVSTATRGVSKNLPGRGHSSCGRGHSWPLNGHCKPPEKGSGQKSEEIWRNLFVKNAFSASGGGAFAPFSSLLGTPITATFSSPRLRRFSHCADPRPQKTGPLSAYFIWLVEPYCRIPGIISGREKHVFSGRHATDVGYNVIAIRTTVDVIGMTDRRRHTGRQRHIQAHIRWRSTDRLIL